ncbi:cytochrome P450 [Litoreibacter roseus]|uniref:Cytochrome P450 n=1 Tax=Litoreibacter roseus TaxID=2601869 RepID=A0A6N6JIC7_9RHOB|nr:cytochrome P450 [Litoreibacter roseus]GFE65835.1 cytochrome P450 [Litoreibacter roseus]
MKTVAQDPTEDAFVQNPYAFYDELRGLGDLVFWDEYDMPMAHSHKVVSSLLRDRRFGRKNPMEVPPAPHTQPFYEIEAHSMLERDPPCHTRLRGLVLRAFTSRRIAGLQPEIQALCHDLIDQFPRDPFDLLTAYATPIPAITIARLLGVPEIHVSELLNWSNAMVMMYQARRTYADEVAASDAATEFAAFLTDYIDHRRKIPADDLITHLIGAEEHGETLSTAELISTCILLLNAGHEATVHSIGNGVKHCLETGCRPSADPAPFAEEVLRLDPPLHVFMRYASEDVDVFGHSFAKGQQVGLILASANHDPSAFEAPSEFRPGRASPTHASFGGGIHFCVGAPLARLELGLALNTLFERCPNLRLDAPPRYAPNYHFHGLSELRVSL